MVCGAGLTSCSGSCVNLSSDRSNCGLCGRACGADQVCSGGTCSSVCGAGLTSCSGFCVNLSSDRSNCGLCGRACGADQVCSGGECFTTCGTGLTNCSGSCVDLSFDAAHCGSCTRSCAVPETCRGGLCCAPCDLECCAAGESCIVTGGAGRCCAGDKVCGTLCCDTPNRTCIAGGCCIDIASADGIVGSFRLEADLSCADGNSGHRAWEFTGWLADGEDQTAGLVDGHLPGEAYQEEDLCNVYAIMFTKDDGEDVLLEVTWDGSSGSVAWLYFVTTPSFEICATEEGNISNARFYRL